MIAIDDPQLPGLAELTPERLCRITGAAAVSLTRLRYRPGQRAILHVEIEADGGQGTIWFFRGDKARRLARRTAGARYDNTTGALYQAFPDDHRMPQIRAFLDDFSRIVPRLTGTPALGGPELLRYRPGLCCTFRHETATGSVFVKILGDESPRRNAVMNRRMAKLLASGPVFIPRVTGTEDAVSAMAYSAAQGVPLDVALRTSDSTSPIFQAIEALRHFWRLPLAPARCLSREALIWRAAQSAALVAVMAPECRTRVERLLVRLAARAPALGCRPIHGDVKLEHLFLDGARTWLIDTESVSLGPPDYDLAQLYGRLWQAELEGALPTALTVASTREVRRAAGDAFGWCLDVVALRLARYYAQRPGPRTEERIGAMLERLG